MKRHTKFELDWIKKKKVRKTSRSVPWLFPTQLWPCVLMQPMYHVLMMVTRFKTKVNNVFVSATGAYAGIRHNKLDGWSPHRQTNTRDLDLSSWVSSASCWQVDQDSNALFATVCVCVCVCVCVDQDSGTLFASVCVRVCVCWSRHWYSLCLCVCVCEWVCVSLGKVRVSMS